MNSVLTNATFLALLVAVCTYIYQKWTRPVIRKKTRNGIKKFRKKIWFGWPLITGALAWVLIFGYQQFYRSDAKQIKLIPSNFGIINESNPSSVSNVSNVSNPSNVSNDFGLNGLNSNGINIPFDFDDNDLPSVFIPVV